MNRRPRILSFPAAVVTFFKSLKLPSTANQYPQRTPQISLVSSPGRIHMQDAEMEAGYLDLVKNDCSKATENEEQGLEANATSLSPHLELQTRSKSPLSVIASPIMENWDSLALEVCRTLPENFVLFSLTNSSLPVRISPHTPRLKMKNPDTRSTKMIRNSEPNL